MKKMNNILYLTALGLMTFNPTISNAQTFYQCIKKPEEQKPEPTTYCYPGYYLSSNETCVKCPDYQYSPGGRTKACKYLKVKVCDGSKHCDGYKWVDAKSENKGEKLYKSCGDNYYLRDCFYVADLIKDDSFRDGFTCKIDDVNLTVKCTYCYEDWSGSEDTTYFDVCTDYVIDSQFF
ncbi:MAG: hypothetical protein ACI4N3_04025 [Alphaproteobacteria bacterium]